MGYDLLMGGFGILFSLLLIGFGLSFFFDDPAVGKKWKKHTGKIVEADSSGFTIEYGATHVYTGDMESFYENMGYAPDINKTFRMADWIRQQKYTLERMLGRGYNRENFFRFYEGKKMYVWTDPDDENEVFRIWGDDRPAKRSAGRAFLTAGIFLLIATLLALNTALTSL